MNTLGKSRSEKCRECVEPVPWLAWPYNLCYNMTMKKHKKDLISLIYSKSKYWGKHVIILGDRIFTAKTGTTASRLLEKLIMKYPHETPVITYVPKADALILFIL